MTADGGSASDRPHPLDAAARAFKRIHGLLVKKGLFWAAMGLATLLVFNLVADVSFFSISITSGWNLSGTPILIFHQGAEIMLLALGMTLVIATGGVDLSVGSIMAMSGALAALLVTRTGLPFAVVMIVALTFAVIVGLVNGALVAYAGVQPIVATLIMMVAGRGIAMLMTSGQKIPFAHSAFEFLAGGHLLMLPSTVIIVALMTAAAVLVTRKTAAGLLIEAVGDNATASRFSGIDTGTVRLMVYGSSGFCAGLAGLISASGIKAADPANAGVLHELDAIFAVLVGGTALTGGRFNLLGSLLGAVILRTLILTMMNQGVNSAVMPVPKAIVILAVCLLQSEKFRAHVGAVGRKLRTVLAPARRPACDNSAIDEGGRK